MDKNSNKYTLTFAVIMCVVLATCLAATFNGLKSRMDKNALFDKQRNVLMATGLYQKDRDSGMTQAQLEKLFRDKVQVQVLEFIRSEVTEQYKERGEEKSRKVLKVTGFAATDHKLTDLPRLQREQLKVADKDQRKQFGEVYTAETADGRSYCIPISGYGLWSTLYGFLALQGDANKVQGITFYKHGETPGLGGEVEMPWWQDPWHDKEILDDQGQLCSITVLKGTGNETNKHQVDGISGATITCNGVNKFVLQDLKKYEPYLKTLRKN